MIQPQRVLLCISISLLAACGNLPTWDPIPTRDLHVVADYAPPGTAPLQLPASSDSLKVLELQMHPPPVREEFKGDIRHVKLPLGSKTFRVTCRLRLYQQLGADGEPLPFPAPESLFPGAKAITLQ